MKEVKLYTGRNRGKHIGVMRDTGLVTIVDDEDFALINSLVWRLRKGSTTYYACTILRFADKCFSVSLHNYLIGQPIKGYVTDHKDGNGWVNTRKNIRTVTYRQNCQNKKTHRDGAYPGVSVSKKGVISSCINVCGVVQRLGEFITQEDAFLAYQTAVRSLGQEVLDYGS